MDIHPFDPQFRLRDTLILASLSREPSHGYSLEAHVRNISLGRVTPGANSVYKAVRRLLKAQYVVELEAGPAARRRTYDITPEGRAQLGRDLALLRRVLQAFDFKL